MGKRDLTAGTRALIAAAAEETPAELDLEHAARRLNVSSRTLIRHLKQAGTSFQTLRDDALKQRTLELLEQPGLSIQDIAATLGYSDPANFGRAFKRWFGMSPGSFRKTIGA
jgi:AraC-like DNA-binding protein